MWELDCEESWEPKNWCFWTVVLEKTLESPLDCKEIQPVHSKGDQSWVFFERNDAKAETPILWPPHGKSWLIGKDSDAGRDWGQEEKGTTEDEMAWWHHQLDGCEFEWTLGIGDGQGGLACCNSRGRKESDTTERLNWTDRVSNIDRIESQKHICLVVVLSSVTSSHWQRFCRLRGHYFSSSSSGWKQKTHWGTSLCVNLVFLRKSQVPDGLFPSFLSSFLPLFLLSYFPSSLFLSFLGLIHSILFYLINV